MKNLPIKTQDRTMLGYEGLGVDYVHLPPDQPELHKRDSLKVYFNVLRRRKWYIIIPILFVVPILVASAALEEPIYQASARVQIKPSNPQVLDIRTLIQPELNVEDLLTEYQLIRSEEHLVEVVDRLQLQDKLTERNDLVSHLRRLKGDVVRVMKRLKNRSLALIGIEREESIASVEGDGVDMQRLAALAALQQAIGVQPQQGGQLVDISVSSLVPAHAAAQANTVAEVYIDKNFEKIGRLK